MAALNETKIILTAEDKTGNAFGAVRGKLSGLADEAKSVASGVGALGAAFGVLGGVAAGAISVSALKGAVDMLDMLDDLSEKTGIATESLAALRYAGEVVGTPVEALATGVRKLSLNMAAAAGGGKEQAAAFQAIGVAFKNLDGSLRGSDQVLGDIANKFASFKDGPEKAALAVELFGKAGADMIPLLNKGAVGIADLRTEAERLGIVFSGDLAANAAEFNDNLKKIQLSGQAFGAAMASEVLPTLNELARVFLESKDGGNSLAQILGTGLKTVLEAVTIAGANVSFVLQGIGREAGAIAAQAVALATLDIAGFNAISKAVKEDADRARRELDALQQRILGVGTSLAGAGRGTAADPRILGGVDSIKAQAEALKAAAPVVKKLGDTAKATADEFQKLLDKIQGKSSGLDADFAKNIGLLNKALAAGKLTWDDYARVVDQYISQQPAAVAAAKAATAAMEEQAMAAYKLGRAALDEAEAIDAWRKAQSEAAAKSVQSINERIQGLQDEEAAAEIARQQNISLAAAIEQVAIARLKEQQTVLIAGSEAFDAVQREIEARERLVGVINTKDLREKESTGWAQVFSSIDTTAHDTWTNVWESGSASFKRLGQTLKASILDVLYQMTVRPFIVKIGASILGGGFATAATAATGSGTGVLSGIGNLSSLLTGGASFGNFAGTAVANLTGTGLDGLLATNAAFGTAAAEGMGAVMSGLMTAAPYLAAVAAVYAIAKALDHSGTPHTGGGSMYSAAGGLSSTPTGQWTGGTTWGDGFGSVMGSETTNAMTAQLAQSVVGMLDATATAFGQQAGYTMATSFADDSSKDPAWGSLVIKQLDNVLVNWNDTRSSKWAPRTFSDGSTGSAEYLAAISADVRKAIDGIGLPDWASTMLDQLGDAPTLEQLAATVQAINTTQAALVQMRGTLVGFANVGDEAVAKLIAASGGVGNLATNVSTYYDNFYTEGEKQSAVMKSLTEGFAAVNVTMPKTRDEFRATVEALQAATADNPYAAAALAEVLKMSGAFASIVPPAEAATEAVAASGAALQQTAEEIATLEGVLNSLRNPVRSLEDIARNIVSLEGQRGSLNVDLLTAQGDTAGAKALQRSLDTVGFTEAELALYDYNQALRDQIAAINAATQASATAADKARAEADAAIAAAQQRAQAIVSERSGLQDQLDSLTLTSAQLIDKQRAALDESNRALFDQVQAASAAADAERTLAASRQTIASERAGLQDQLDRLTLTSAQLIDKQRAALDESNRALFDQVQAANDAAEAERALATERQRVDTQRAGLQSQLDALTMTSAQLMEQQRSALDESNRALFDQVQAATAAAEAERALADQTQRAASERIGLQDQLDRLTLTAAQLVEKQRATLDESNRALFDQVQAATAAAEERAAQERAAQEAASAAADALQRASDAADSLAQKIASEREGLWKQYLTASGDTDALRALELAALDESNRALQQQIWALEDQKTAAEQAAAAAQELADTWSNIGTTLLDEAKRLRGMSGAQGAVNYATLMAQFATLTGQARAGDQTAASQLAEASRAASDAYAGIATSAQDLARMQASLATSLEQTAGLVTSADLATQGARPVLTALPVAAAVPVTIAQGGAAAPQVVSDAGVREKLDDVLAALEAIATSAGLTLRLHQRWDGDGLLVRTDADQPLAVTT